MFSFHIMATPLSLIQKNIEVNVTKSYISSFIFIQLQTRICRGGNVLHRIFGLTDVIVLYTYFCFWQYDTFMCHF